MIILHYTAGVSAQSSPRYLARPDVKASAHLVIGRLGKIIQLVSFDVEAWHAGQSSYAGRTCLNRFSIGIELDNLGRLAWTAGRFVAEYTGRQKEVLREVCGLLKARYPIRYVGGHSDVTGRKQNPGPKLHEFMCK